MPSANSAVLSLVARCNGLAEPWPTDNARTGSFELLVTWFLLASDDHRQQEPIIMHCIVLADESTGAETH